MCFADDMVYLVSSSCLHKLKQEANNGINLIKNWLCNLILLNLTLYVLSVYILIYIFISNDNNNLNFDKLILHNVFCKSELNNCICPLINKTSPVKYLGIHFDEFLK